jgi:hypothetical protein
MAIAVLLAMAAPAAATPLETAKAAVDASDYFSARTAIAQALAQGDNSPEEVAELYRLSGIVSGALGDPKAATEAFERCLALAPKAALSMGTSPKITRPFTAAREFWAKNEPFKVKAETETTPPSVTVIVVNDPLSMVARVRAAVSVDGKPEQTFDRPASERTSIELPAGARLDVRVIALDARGNRLAELGTKDVPIVIIGKPAPAEAIVTAPPPPPPPRPARSRPILLRWQLWTGVAIAFGGAATYFGIDAVLTKRDLDELNANSPNHTFDEATALESRARRGVLFANIGYATAGAFAVGAVILYLTRPRGVESRDRTARNRIDDPGITVAPVRGGGAVVVGGHF